MPHKLQDRKRNRAVSRLFILIFRHVPPSRQALTKDVPVDALALGRSRQVIKQGWAARLRGLKSLGKNRSR
jgi:hypothetical protein